MKHLRAVSFLLPSLLLLGCGTGSDDPASCAAFRTSLSVRDRMSQAATVFNTGEPIAFQLEITNTRNASSTLTAGSSCTAVVFEVSDSAGRRLWGSADRIACIQMLQPRIYAPLETIAESAEWDQRDSGGTVVPVGSFTVRADVGQYASDTDGLVDCRAALGRSSTFRIQ